MTCQSCQERLLEYVYGLLDAQDQEDAATARELQKHLEECQTCQTAHRRALEQKSLLALASKISSDIRFTAPQVEPVASTLAPKHHADKSAKINAITWYATVACLLVALCAGIGGAYWWGVETKWKQVEIAQNDVLRVGQKLSNETSTLSDEKPLQALQSQLVALRETWKTKENEALAKARSQRTYLQVIAPPAAETGNPTNLLIVQHSLDNQPRAINNVAVKVLDETDHPIEENSYANRTPSNQYQVTFPKLAYRESNYTFNISTDSSSLAVPSVLSHQFQALHAEYVAHLVTDKPLYLPGETVCYRALALVKGTLRPVPEELEVKFALDDPNGTPISVLKGKAHLRQNAQSDEFVRDIPGKPLQGVAAATYPLPANALSGEYTLRVEETRNRFAPQQVKFLVNRAEPPRFNKDLLHFSKLSYTAGETVELSGTIKLAANYKSWSNGAVAASVLIDGNYYDAQGKQTPETYPIKAATDATGMLKLQFQLPKQIQQGHAVVSLQLDREARDKSEIWTQPLHITLNRPSIEFFPEGGDLIADVPNRVYFMMRNPQGEPIDGQARLLDSGGSEVAELKTFRDETQAGSARGMGSFSFTPKAEQTYWLAFFQPKAEKSVAQLPIAKSSGVILHIENTVLAGPDSIHVQLQNAAAERDLLGVVYCRGQMLGMQTCKVSDHGTQSFDIPVNSPLGGVSRVTIFALTQEQQRWKVNPVAERLLYRQPSQSLNLGLRAQAVNDHEVKLKLTSKTEQQNPTPAYVTVVAVNQSVVSLADDKTARQLPAHFLLAQEVRDPEDLENADFFLSDHPSAKKALDLLLGVQGWRRFKEVDQLPIVANNAQLPRSWNEALPVLLDNRDQVLRNVDEEVHKQLLQSEGKLLQRIEDAEEGIAHEEKTIDAEKERALQARQEWHRDKASSATQLIIAQEAWQQFQNWYRLAVASLLVIFAAAVLCLAYLKRRQMPRHLSAVLVILSLLTLAPAGYLLVYHSQHLDNQTKVAEMAILAKPANEPARMLQRQGIPGQDPEPIVAGDRGQARAKPMQKWSSGDGPAAKEESADKKIVVSKGLAGKDQNAKFDEAKPAFKTPAGAPAPNAVVRPPERPIPSMAEKQQLESVARPEPSSGQQPLAKGQTSDFSPSKALVGRNLPGQAYAAQTYNQKVENKVKLQQNLEQQLIASARKAETPALSAKSRASGGEKKEADATKRAEANLEFRGGGVGGGGADRSGLGAKMADRDALQPAQPFFVREYAWNRDNPPDDLKTPSWSQTIYWNPMLVIANGELTIPLELPKTEGAYRISVFGHGGDGRLGATSIILKTPVTAAPLSLQTKLSTERAKRNDLVQLEIALTNSTNLRQNRVIAKIHLPDGVSLPPNFKLPRPSPSSPNADEVDEPSTWSVKDKDLTLSWDELPAGKKVRVVLHLICQKPGNYHAAGARAYLENQENQAVTAGPLHIVIDSP